MSGGFFMADFGALQGIFWPEKRHLCVSKKRFGVWTETHLRFPLNALTFEIKRPCVLIQTQGRFFEGGKYPTKIVRNLPENRLYPVF
ncbi:hypothetical protein [uncultured Bacteroides sp.]|uniref:hypothetical protein n=1 Tax=uncultured Bacteroides sp. TaxID=162156 RepID=UPI00280BCA4E|nr:hypothetical protein [uncultured Bacteroides sp.]